MHPKVIQGFTFHNLFGGAQLQSRQKIRHQFNKKRRCPLSQLSSKEFQLNNKNQSVSTKIKNKRYAAMDDVLTESPPPSRFFDEDLDTFIPSPSPLPSPFLLLNPNPNPNLLVIAISPVSRTILHYLPSKTLIGSLFLPEIPLSGNPLLPSPTSKSFNLYSGGSQNSYLASVQYTVPAERSKAVAECLIGGVNVDRVMIFDCVKSQNYRGRIEVHETLAFKLETKEQRSDGANIAVKGIGYLPSGSVMDGLGAAVLTECQMKGIKATLIATWPENGGGEVLKMVFGELGFDVGRIEGEFSKVNARSDLDLYT